MYVKAYSACLICWSFFVLWPIVSDVRSPNEANTKEAPWKKIEKKNYYRRNKNEPSRNKMETKKEENFFIEKRAIRRALCFHVFFLQLKFYF